MSKIIKLFPSESDPVSSTVITVVPTRDMLIWADDLCGEGKIRFYKLIYDSSCEKDHKLLPYDKVCEIDCCTRIQVPILYLDQQITQVTLTGKYDAGMYLLVRDECVSEDVTVYAKL